MLLGLITAVSAVPLVGEGYLGGAELSVSEDLEIRYYQSDRVLEGFEEYERLFDYVEQVNRLNLLANGSGYQVGAQVDQVFLLGNRYYLNDTLVYERELLGPEFNSPRPDLYANVEKFWWTNRFDRATVQLGDSYTSFGRGLALNLVRNTDIDVDTSIRGARVTYKSGDWALTGVSGLTNPQQVLQDNPNVRIEKDRGHMITGVRVERYGLGPASLGAHAVGYSFARGDETGSPWLRYEDPLDAVVGGVTAELFGVAGADIYLEADVFSHRAAEWADEVDAEAENGRALYGSVAYYVGPATLLLEARSYRNTEFLNSFSGSQNYEIVSGPTLEYERVITEDSSAAVNSNDIDGVRARVDLFLPIPLAPRLELGVHRDRELGGLHFNQTPETIIHPVVGADYLGEDVQALVNGGFRLDIRDGAYGVDRLAHLDLTVKFPLGPVHGEFTTDVQRFWWGANAQQQDDFFQTASSLGLGWHGFTLVVYQDFTNNPLIDSTGNLGENLYGALELQYQPNSATTVKAFYGAYRAGIRCAGGQCRQLPGFEGARLAVTTSF